MFCTEIANPFHIRYSYMGVSSQKQKKKRTNRGSQKSAQRRETEFMNSELHEPQLRSKVLKSGNMGTLQSNRGLCHVKWGVTSWFSPFGHSSSELSIDSWKLLHRTRIIPYFLTSSPHEKVAKSLRTVREETKIRLIRWEKIVHNISIEVTIRWTGYRVGLILARNERP